MVPIQWNDQHKNLIQNLESMMEKCNITALLKGINQDTPLQYNQATHT